MTRWQEHLAEVQGRLVRSRYDDAREGWDRLRAGVGHLRVATRDLPGDDLPPARLLPPTALRLARDHLDLERSAEVLSAVLGADLDLVRRHLGGNLRQVDGASVLLAVRHGENAVGTVTLVLTEDAAGTVAGVHALAVAAPYRGRGIGSALAGRALELGAAAGADLAVATSLEAAGDVLERLGLRPVGDRPAPA